MENNDITYFGKTNFRGQEHVFGIKRDDRRRHMYVIGKTGMGKTTLLENMIISDINSGNGLAVVDPHGDLAEKILSFIPASRVNDVVYFNPADIDYPIAFNVMEHVDPKYRHLVASGLIGVFKKIWADSWGPRLEYLLRNTILGLLEYPDSTLLGVPRMLIDDDYRKKVVSKISDPVVKTFWNDEFTKYSKQFMVEAISPIQNKVGQFLSSSLVRNIVSQPHSSIDMRDIMDNKKIFIINLAKGRIGEDYSALLGAMIITKIQLAAMGRVDTPEPERKDFYLYVDEFQNFATESFAGILSEARKYRLDLIVAHQYIGQLEETVRDAIFGNVGTIVTFRVGAADAEFLEKEFEPIFMMNDLVNLAKYDMYLKLMIDGVSGDAFSATSLPPFEITSKSDPEKIIKVSRERYTRKREVVEDKVARWSGYVKDEESDEWRKEVPERESSGNRPNNNNANHNQQPPKEKVDNRELWDAVCAVCGTGIKVPFQPDPSRETYCKDCLLKVRKQMAEVIKAPAAPTDAIKSQVMEKVREEIPAPAPAPQNESVYSAHSPAAPQKPTVTAPEASGETVETESVETIQKEVSRLEIKKETSVPVNKTEEIVAPKTEIKKPAYDPQKMIEFYERKKRAAEEREKRVIAPEKPQNIIPSVQVKKEEIIIPKPKSQAAKVAADQKMNDISYDKPRSDASPMANKDAKEIKEGEVIRFD
jgi:CxxC-x17-CxxC domain-containing protein